LPKSLAICSLCRLFRASIPCCSFRLAFQNRTVHTIRITVKSYSRYKHPQRQATGTQIVLCFWFWPVAKMACETPARPPDNAHSMQQPFARLTRRKRLQ
jgi:hypothetical protein